MRASATTSEWQSGAGMMTDRVALSKTSDNDSTATDLYFAGEQEHSEQNCGIEQPRGGERARTRALLVLAAKVEEA